MAGHSDLLGLDAADCPMSHSGSEGSKEPWNARILPHFSGWRAEAVGTEGSGLLSSCHPRLCRGSEATCQVNAAHLWLRVIISVDISQQGLIAI